MLSIDGIEHYRLPAAWPAADNFRLFAMVKRAFIDFTRTYEGDLRDIAVPNPGGFGSKVLFVYIVQRTFFTA
jgi:hypothetical protein